MILSAAVLSLSLLVLPIPPTLLSSAVSAVDSAGAIAPSAQRESRDDRELALNRPTRSGRATVRVVQEASRVPHSLVPFASCVLERESGGSLARIQSGAGARNPSSSASGRWQFLDTSWRRGLSFMVRDRLVRFGMPKAQAREVRLYLGARHISEWSGWWQDIGFLEVIHRGGRHHWNGGSHSC